MNHRALFRAPAPLLAVLALCACNANAPGPSASAPVPAVSRVAASPDFQLPAGAPCAGDIERWKAVQANDHKTGQVDDAVYSQIAGEIANASAACQSGRDGEARAMVSASRRRHGYPG
jgi:hypothetical protein